jgi:prephenate dehydratase/chorismate mutase/prephenate dehydratase
MEEQQIDRLIERLKNPGTAETEGEDSPKVAYLGPEGTYTEEAAQFWFRNGDKLSPEKTVNDAISAVQTGNAAYAVIPQENTLGGAVVNYVDALIAADDTYVVGEVVLPISQTLMGVPGSKLSDIRTVCSHAQGLTQSAGWREQNLPDAKTKEMESTAAAASYVAEQKDPSIAAVAAPGAAKLYGLSVLAENVQITDANKTRFYVLSSSRMKEESHKHAVFVAACEANRIDDIIVEIHNTGLEFVTIHDRPEGSRLGSYRYIIELEDEDGITEEELAVIEEIPELRCLGSFDMAEKQNAPAE